MSAITTTMKTKHNTFTVYRDRKRHWRWRLTTPNGRILATSGEGYKRKLDCLIGMILVSRYSIITTYQLLSIGLNSDAFRSALCADIKIEDAREYRT